MQKRYNTVELTHQTIENSITNARITLQLFETTDPEQEKKLNHAKRSHQPRNQRPGRGNRKESQLFPGAGTV